MILTNDLDLDEDCEGEDCPCEGDDCNPCEGEECPCEGEECPCEGEECPCEGEECPCEGGECIGVESFTAFIERKEQPRTCVKGDFSALDDACDDSQIFNFILIPDTNSNYIVSSFEDKCLDIINSVVNCNYESPEFYSIITGLNKITNMVPQDLKLTVGEVSFSSGSNELLINIQNIIKAD